MNILFLGYKNSPLIKFLENQNHSVIVTEKKITPVFLMENQVDFVVSYGYRHIIKKDILDLLPGKVINLHISYLPYNKGADPNFWSFVENTPKGVTIHRIDEGLDTGDILVQKEMEFSVQDETLRTSYEKLQKEIQNLFKENWNKIVANEIKPTPQKGIGTYHRKKDKEKLIQGIEHQYLDMKISDLLQHINKKDKL